MPDDSPRGYQAFREPATAFRTDPTGGTIIPKRSIPLWNKGVPVVLTGGAQVSLYGTSYSTIYIMEGGWIGFLGRDDPSLSGIALYHRHFFQPHISALYSVLEYDRGGTISWKQLIDRVAVTFENVAGSYLGNSFQTEMFFDGRIRISYLNVTNKNGLVGLSRGKGIPVEFADSDFSAYPLYQELHLTLPGSATEGDGLLAGQGRVGIPTAVGQNVTVKLKSGDVSEAMVPPTVTIAAGQLSGTFDVTILDDAEPDGTQLATITASAPLYAPSRETIAVHDNESATLTITIPSSSSEDAGTAWGMLQTNAVSSSDLTVSLASSQPTTVQVPASIVIPAGQMSAGFVLTILDDSLIEGTRHATVTATVTHWPVATASIDILDNESRNLAVVVPGTAAEGISPLSGSVSIAGALPGDLVIALASSDTTEATVPATVTIAAGQTSAPFAIVIPDDTETDGVQVATITASALNFSNGSGTIRVSDNDAHHFTFAPIGGSQVRNAPFAVNITARDVNDAVIANYSRTVSVACFDASHGSQPVTPASLTGFTNGVWTGKLSVGGFGNNLVLTVNDGAGHGGTSNPFSVGTGSLDHFAWSNIPSPQTIDTPFPVTVTAQDEGNNTVANFTGPANLAAQNLAIGTDTPAMGAPLSPAYRASRTQVIYLASELKGARKITDLALYVATAPSQILNRWTIRMKHTPLASYVNQSWEASGWTLVHQSNATVSATGWVTFHFTTPFDYDGTSNLMVDFSFNNASTSPAALCRYSNLNAGANRMLDGHSDAGNAGDPLLWTGTSTGSPGLYARVLNVQFLVDAPVPIDPPQTGSFANGVWSGNVSVPFAATATKLSARDTAGHFGNSNSVEVTSTIAAEFPFGETFESGFFGPAWTVSGANSYRTEVTTASAPHTGLYHLKMDARNGGTGSRNEATLTIDLAGATGVTLTFWAKEFSDTPHGPPSSPFINGADFDGVAISADGVSWYEVQPLRTLTNSYAQLTVNLDAAILARGLSYNPAFKIRFNQYGTTFLLNGIAIDDIAITGSRPNPLTLSIPAQANEGGGLLTGTVSLPAVQASEVVVSLQSSAPGRAGVPATVSIPAGQMSASFGVAVFDNATIEGTTNVTVKSSATGFAPGRGVLAISDNETNSFTLVLPSVAGQTNRTVQGLLKLDAQVSRAIVATFTSSAPSKAAVSASVTIQPGQTVVPFNIAIGDEAVIDGLEIVTITASVPGWATVSGALTVIDTPSPTLTLTGPLAVTEGDGSAIAHVSISAPLLSPVTVALFSSDTDSITVPPTVTIPAGLTSAAFAMTVLNDAAFDGAQNVTITANAPGFASTAALAVSAGDNELYSFRFPEIPNNQVRGAPFEVTLIARDIKGAPILNYAGPVTLSGHGSNGPIAVTPTEIREFVNGVWTGYVTVLEYDSQFVLTAEDGYGHRTTTEDGEDGELIEVTRGGPGNLTVSTVASPQSVGKPFGFVITALDSGNNVADYGPGFLSIRAGVPREPVTIGSGTTNWDFPIGASSKAARTQVIYPASELGGARRLTSLALNVSLATLPAHPLQGWTIRMKHTAKESHTSAIWETTGWTTLCALYEQAIGNGWVTFWFKTPFDYNGTGNLMIEFSYDDILGVTGPSGTCRCSTAAAQRSLFAGSDGAFGSPLTWEGAASPAPAPTNRVPDIRLTSESPVAIFPQVIDLGDRPQWTEQVTLAEAASGVQISVVDDLGHVAASNVFDVVVGTPELNTEPAFTGGTKNTISWPGLLGSTGYEVQRAIAPSFTANQTSGWITDANHTFDWLPDSVRQFYRVRARFGAVETAWSPAVFSTQDATAPAITLALPTGQAYTAKSAVALQGTAFDVSCIQFLTANGGLANTGDGFAHWTAAIQNLALGPNSLLVVAADQAAPPNTATLLRNVTRQRDSDGDSLPDEWETQHGLNPLDNGSTLDRNGPFGDANNNGIVNLLEYALAPDAVISNGLLQASRQTNPADGHDYMVVTYRRHVGLLDFRCVIETSEDLLTWSATSGDVQEILPATPSGDGATETVAVRIKPALEGGNVRMKTARVRVISN